jgi:uncharacterized membrane protein
MMDWLVAGGRFGGGALVWTGEPWIVAAAGVLAIVAFVLSLGGGARGRWPERALLALGLALVVAVVARPTWLAEGERVEPGRFVVLVDASRSMAVAEPGGGTRLDRALALAERIGPAETFHFGGELRAGAPPGATMDGTDIAGALQAITRRYAGERLAGIAVVSDGIDRAGLVRTDAAGARSLDPSVLPTLLGPLTVYAAGTERAVPDLSITDVHAGSFAFLRAPFKLDVAVEQSGLALDQVTVTLTRNGQPAGSRTVTLDAEGRGRASFELTPDTPGRFVFEASVPVAADDAVPSNNVMSRVVRVVRDRVRVLQVCGSPSLDEKFLRLFLKEDPGVDLVSFFILRTVADLRSGFSPDELSLIEFPYRRLFADDLSTFDLVILQNFDYEPYFERDSARLLGNVAQYVRDGGALAMIGGDRSFDLGKYAGTPLAEVLPVQLGVSGDPVDEASFAPVLTEAGARHPVTRLVAELPESAALWARLPPMHGTNLTLGAVPDAAVLLAHPTQTVGGAPLPVLAVRQVGEGRSMALTVDSSWRWSFSEAARGGGNQAYLRFWKSAMRWLVGDPDEQAVVLEVARENVEPGEVLRVTARVRDAGFGPVAGANVLGSVFGPDGEVPLSSPTGADGEVAFVVPTDHRGAHRVKVRAVSADGAALGSAETVYAVVTRDPELDRIAPDGASLRALAEASGGLFVASGEWSEPLRDADAGRLIHDRRENPLWSAPLLALLAATCLSTSWWLRRRAGHR